MQRLDSKVYAIFIPVNVTNNQLCSPSPYTGGI